MNNQVPEERKVALTKTFAIVGFVAIILFAVWLSVQVVSLMPSAFSSLASLADGVYNYKPNSDMMVTTKNSVVNASETFTINYTTASEDGLYTFSYECVDGVALSVMVENTFVATNCDTPVAIDGSGSTELSIESEKQRFTDVAFTITFTGVDGAELAADNQVTIVNASIPTTVAVATGAETDDSISIGTISDIQTGTYPEPEVAGESVSPTTPITVGQPEIVEEFIYAIPTSDPNGTVDLAVRFLGVGILTDNNTFIRTGVIGLGQTGSFQFEVKNLGTKTSDEWSYETTMPGDIDYESDTQAPLKPNERAVITLGFTGLTQTGVESFGAAIETDEDVLESNNHFISAVTITD